MTKSFIACLLASALLSAAPLKAETELSLMSGRESGTYYQIGKDLQKLVETADMDLNVIPSAGSVENIIKVHEFSSIQLGLTQLDTLTFQSLQPQMQDGDIVAELETIVNNMQLVLPLYQEEVQLLARKEIKTLADLNGKTVATGRRLSGIHSSALNLLRLFEIKAGKTLNLDPQQALAAMREGQADALFYVGAVPARFLSEAVTAEDGFHLLALPHAQIADTQILKPLYQAATIPAATYPWQSKAVATLSVTSLLFTTRVDDCSAVGMFARTLYQGLPQLQAQGHRKWRDVSFNKERLLENKSLSPCVAEQLRTLP